MYISTISAKNYRCFEDITINFNPGMNVIVGNNGVGKTTILDALSIGIGSIFLGIESNPASGIRKEDIRILSKWIGSTLDRQPQLPVDISCVGVIGGEKYEWSRSLNTQAGSTTHGKAVNIKKLTSEWQERIRKGDTNIILPLVSYYGTGRLWAQKKESSVKNISNRLDGYIDCLSAESNERLMLKWFEKMTFAQLQDGSPIPELEAVKKAVIESYIESGADVKNVRLFFNVKSHQLEVSYKNSNGVYINHPFHELSDGYRNTLGLIADIAYRMAVLNPQLLENVTKQTPGIVLIDEVDLHLHPIWQKKILNTLKKVFPLVQFIVTTHSPSIISSARSEELLIFDGKSAEPFAFEVYGKDVNSVLSEIMGTSERPDEITRLFKELDELMESGDYVKAEDKLNTLREILGNNDNGVISASVALDFQKDWEDE